MKLILFAHLHETENIHAMSHASLDDDLQKILGFESISASQLSLKNNEINPSILANLFLDLVTQIQGFHVEKKTESQLKIIDSTKLPLNLTH